MEYVRVFKEGLRRCRNKAIYRSSAIYGDNYQNLFWPATHSSQQGGGNTPYSCLQTANKDRLLY